MPMLDRANWWSNLIIIQIYRSNLFLFLYNTIKAVYGYLTGTSEIYRICDSVVKLQHLTPIKIPENTDYIQFCHSECKKLYVDPETCYRLDLCILYSSQLQKFRRPFESWYTQFDVSPLEFIEPGAGQKFEKLIQTLMDQKKFPRVDGILTPQALVLRATMEKVYSTFQLLHLLNKRAATRYDINVQSNEVKLMEIWDKLMPHEPLTARFTLQWQKIGFQGKDPSTDFRSMGLLALDNLHYFCSVYTDTAQNIVVASHHPISWFSFAIIGINMTAYLLRLVRTRQLQWVFFCHGSTKQVFNEVYCFLMDEFEKSWSNQPKPPTMMDFNQIFKKFQMDFEVHLMQRQPCFLNSDLSRKKIE